MRLTSIVTTAITELFSVVILLILDGPNSSSLPSNFDFKTGKTSQVPRVRDLNRFVCRLIGTTIIFFFLFPQRVVSFCFTVSFIVTQRSYLSLIVAFIDLLAKLPMFSWYSAVSFAIPNHLYSA